MEKDNRSHNKRSRMRAFKKNHYQKISQNSNTTPIEECLIDVADSSDDRFSYRSSQWSRRSPGSEIDDEELDSSEQIGGDFDMLQKMPIAGGSGHFQFSSEKNWEIDDDDINIFNKSAASEYFTLNLALLNAGLQTIPFYKRMDYPGIFNKSDINIMNKEAEIAEAKYQEILKEHEKGIKPSSGATKRNTSAKSIKSDKNSVVTPAAVEEPSNLQIDTKDAELDELLSLTNSVAKVSFKNGENGTDTIVNPENPDTNAETKTEEKTAESNNIEVGNKEDIQQWLDDILE